MGSRTLNHIIEDESRQFFRGLLPKFWVYRDKGEDYGIDSEVEIFNEKGNPTGLVFWVQLKGTASKEAKTIQTVSFKNEKLNQFRNYNIPVLIARYSTINKTLYFRWAKSIYKLHREANNTKVTFLEDNIWDNSSPQQILSYLNRQTAIKQGAVRFPIKTFFKRTSLDLTKSVPYSNLVLIKNYIAGYGNYFAVTNDETESFLQIIIENNQIAFSFTDLAFASLGLDFSNLSSQQDKKVLQYILLTFCSSLFELNRNDLGNIVFFDNDLFPLAEKEPTYLAYFIQSLLNGPNFTKVMYLLNGFLAKEKQNNNFIEAIVNIILLADRDNFNDEQLELTNEFLLQNLTRAKSCGNTIAIGTACYNLANFYRGLGDYELSLFYYFEARRNQPGYKKHDYYYHEIAGLLFLLGKYNFAENFYRKALELNSSSFIRKGLLADCLIYAGKYKLATDQLDEFLRERHDQAENLDEWYLKFSCLQTLLINDYPTIQQRMPEKAELLAEQGEYKNALFADLLCPLAWFNKGVKDAGAGNDVDAFISFVMAGLICNNDVVAWANATMLGLNDGIDKILLINVIKTAHFYNKQNYINVIFDNLSKTDLAQRDIIMELLDKTLPKTPERPVVIRLFENDHDYKAIDLKGR